jgi:hypothetical protein
MRWSTFHASMLQWPILQDLDPASSITANG